ncbi:DUF6843 domain-containing protein [Fictibacillus aquaticus]|uniref:DUF6843 domain-containing protein n=1 Tax=Fictibacillus aquaticus TaxID=2021314 RepID=A0A235F5S2_9BACL|nr:hypothetical protein [Fictibacillus aquaticus]OYD56589.1 hypothetical protein CGZ90_16385 [Fictibacillus aquaticus]
MSNWPAIVRKMLAAFFSTSAISAYFFIWELADKSSGGFFGFFLIVAFYAGVGNYFYGIPVSFLSDFLTKKAGDYRFAAAGFVHIFPALLIFVWTRDLTFFAVICALVFFLADEWMKKKKDSITNQKKKIVFINAAAVIAVFSLLLFTAWKLNELQVFEEKTHQSYVIPAGYTGKVYAVHNVKRGSDPKTVDGYKVVEINDLGYGTTTYSLPAGIIEDKYYYVDNKGNKTRIDEKCISIGGTEGIQGEGYDYESSVFYVTDKNCGEDFQVSGTDYYSEEISLDEILEKEGLKTKDGDQKKQPD